MALSQQRICLTARLPADLVEKARELAGTRSTSLNQLIQEALRKEIAAYRRELAREGYAYYAKEDAAEAEEGMDDWIEIVESDGGY